MNADIQVIIVECAFTVYTDVSRSDIWFVQQNNTYFPQILQKLGATKLLLSCIWCFLVLVRFEREYNFGILLLAIQCFSHGSSINWSRGLWQFIIDVAFVHKRALCCHQQHTPFIHSSSSQVINYAFDNSYIFSEYNVNKDNNGDSCHDRENL